MPTAGEYFAAIKVVADTRDAVAQLARADAAVEKFGRTYREVDRDVRRLQRTQREYQRQQRQTIRSTQSLTRVNRALSAGYTALAAVVSTQLVVSFSNTIDSITLLEERMENLTGDAGQFNQLIALSNDVGVRFEDTGRVATRLALSLEEIGGTTTELNKVTTALFQLGRISGTSPQEQAAGTVQLAQGLASATLQGDELKSVLENLPAVAIELATALGVGTQELKELGAEGELSGRRVYEALLSRTDEIAVRFNELDKTIGQTFATFTNEFKLAIQAIDEEIGASEILKALFERGTEVARRVRLELDFENLSELDQIELQLIRVNEEIQQLNLLQAQSTGDTTLTGSLRPDNLNVEEERARLFRERDNLLRDELVLQQEIYRRQVSQGVIGRQLREEKERERLAQEAQEEAAKGIVALESELLTERERILDTYREQERIINQVSAAGLGEGLPGGGREESLGRAQRIRDERLAELDADRRAEQEAARARVEQINRQGETERKALQRQYDERLEIIFSAVQQQAITEQEGNRAALAARQNFQNELTEIDVEETRKREQTKQDLEEESFNQRQQLAAAYAQAFAGFSALSQEVMGESARTTKAIRTAEAIINTYAAAVRAVEATPGPAGYIAAAGVIAFGLAQVAKIQSTNVERRRFGGLVNAGQPYRVNEGGPELYQTGSSQFLLPNTNGRVVPLQSGGGMPEIKIFNNGPPIRVERTRMNNGEMQVFIAQAVQASREDFQNSLSSGYGSYSESLSRAGIYRRI